MEIMVNPSSGGYYKEVPVATGGVQHNAPAIPETGKKVPQVAEDFSSTSFNEESRYEDVRNAAQAITDHFVVSDTKFTIFKDVTGQYITRFTNLRDGTVTYMPEPELVQFLQTQAAMGLAERKARVELTV